MSNVRETVMTTMGPLLGLAIGLAILSIIAGISIFGTSASSGITSAIGYIASFIGIVGICIAAGIALHAIDKI